VSNPENQGHEEASDVVKDAEAILADSAQVDEAVADEVEVELDELTVLAKERDDMLELAQRTQADFENFRRRALERAEEAGRAGAAAVVSSLLPVLDALELAEAHLVSGADPSEEAKALQQARALLLDTLTKQGLEAVVGAGEAFDPQVHDAVMHVEADGDSDGPVVDEVLRTGWTWKGAVLRPAMVRVKG